MSDTPSENPAPATAQPAGIAVRLAAMTYDGLLLLAIWLIVSAVLVPFGTSQHAAQHHEISVTAPAFRRFVLFPALVLATWLFYGYFWVRVGHTLGMQTWRLKLTRLDGSRVRWSDAIARCAGACLFPLVCGLLAQLAWHSSTAFLTSVLLGFFGNYFWMLWSRNRLAWHDQISGTVVWRLPPEPKKKRRLLAWFAENPDD